MARQLRRSILLYMLGDDFQPSTEVDLSTIGHLFTKEAPVLDMYTNDSPDELKPKIQ